MSSHILDPTSESLEDNWLLSETFPHIEDVIASFRTKDFQALSFRKRFKKINQILCQLIQQAPAESYLLSSLIDYLKRVNDEKLLNETLNFTTFELWLNQFSELSEKDNYAIRGKIVGKMIPRADYQAFFPIGMNKTFVGTHFVAAHLSPDVDTMIASFWGWVDAFGARVGTGLHLWSLPGGPPDSPVSAIFQEIFGSKVFDLVSRSAQTLTLTAMDLVTQHLLIKEQGNILTGSIDHSNEKAIILVNEQGHYLGDWHNSDVEPVRQIIILFKSCLRWFENNLHTNLISLFAKKDLSTEDLPAFYSSVLDVKIKDCEPALEFNEKQKNDLHDFFYKVLGVEKGLEGTFRDLNRALDRLSIFEMLQFQKKIEALSKSDLFDNKGKLREDRPKIFLSLEQLIKDLDASIHSARNYVERLDIVIAIKHKVLGLPTLYLTLNSDVEEMRHKIQNYDFLTVVIHEQDGSLFPVGIVRANDLRKSGLGTVSLRDFCNQDEIKMASYLEVISVVDHHKSSLKTLSVPLALIGDAQSCNVLIAEQAFEINDRYGTGGMPLEEIERQIKEVSTQLSTPKQMRTLQRLLHRRIAAHSGQGYYIHPKREFIEYFCFLQAIFDDTDLLTKVSTRDVVCVAHLLNRLKSLKIGQEVEIVDFDDIPKDKNFTKAAAQRLLQNQDMYALYKKIYDLREREIEIQLKQCIEGKPSNLFVDTKEQNGCARVGQTKIFENNFPYFFQHVDYVRSVWLEKAQEVYRDFPEFDLHIHMISTIASAEDVFSNRPGTYSHQDELWFWIPSTQQGHSHLTSFLASFQYGVKNLQKEMSVEFLGPNAPDYMQIFSHHFFNIPKSISPDSEKGLPIAVLRFPAGTINSRKSMITPYLPRLLS